MICHLDKFKDMLNDVKQEINDNQFKEVYDYFIDEAPNYLYVSKLTETLLSSGIDPTSYLRELPHGYLYFSDVTKYSIRPHIKRIGSFAFNGSRIEEIYIPDNCRFVGSYAFASNNDLKLLSLPNKIDLGDYIVEDCPNCSIEYRGTRDDFTKNIVNYKFGFRGVPFVKCFDGDILI